MLHSYSSLFSTNALRGALNGFEEQLGFTIQLLLDKIEQTQSILSRVQGECQKVVLALNAKKTKYITYNIDTKETTLKQMTVLN